MDNKTPKADEQRHTGLWVIFASLIVIIIGLVITIIVVNVNKTSDISQEDTKLTTIDDDIVSLKEDIHQLIEDKDKVSVIVAYDKFLSNIDSDQDKAAVLVSRAYDLNFICAESCSAEILQDAYRAEDLSHSGTTASVLCMFLGKYGENKEEVIKWCKISSERIPVGSATFIDKED